jgi:hypothetical protein
MLSLGVLHIERAVAKLRHLEKDGLDIPAVIQYPTPQDADASTVSSMDATVDDRAFSKKHSLPISQL